MFGLGGTPTQNSAEDDPSEYTLRTLATDTPSDGPAVAVSTRSTSVSAAPSPLAQTRRAAAPAGLPVIETDSDDDHQTNRVMTRVPTLDPVKSNAFFRGTETPQRLGARQTPVAPPMATAATGRMAQVDPRETSLAPTAPRPVSIDPMSARPTQTLQSAQPLPPATHTVATPSIADFLQNQKRAAPIGAAEDVNFDTSSTVPARPWVRYGGALLLLALLAGIGYGGYSWWIGRTPTVATADTAAIPKAPSLEASKPGEIFLADKPNYLNVTRQGLTTEALVAYLNQIADKVPNNGTAYEFLLRNEKFQSVPFDEFSKLIISDVTVPAMFEGADMTLYITKSLNNRSLSLLITPKGDASRSMSTITATDRTLPTQMKSLYVLGRKQPTIPEESTFGNSDYRSIPIRYTNFTAGDTTLSLDYSLVDGKLLLSTSKDAHRAVLDKIKP
jgi:hypothetical protein